MRVTIRENAALLIAALRAMLTAKADTVTVTRAETQSRKEGADSDQ